MSLVEFSSGVQWYFAFPYLLFRDSIGFVCARSCDHRSMATFLCVWRLSKVG